MKLLRNTFIGYKYGERSLWVSVLYFLKGVARELNVFKQPLLAFYLRNEKRSFDRRWARNGKNYDFNGVLMPKDPNYPMMMVFQDIFFIPCLCRDRFDSTLVRKLDNYLSEGPYCFVGEGINLVVEKGDVVIDAGAWIGDFSAYACRKGAVAYAFEPVLRTFEMLKQTIVLNGFEKTMFPVQSGLGDKDEELEIQMLEGNTGGSSLSIDRDGTHETIRVMTLDRFVQENKVEKIDFIKADIEGFERNLLLGAQQTLKKYAPKLALCTYHLPDDKEVLERLILQANPNYRIVHTRKKIFAQIV